MAFLEIVEKDDGSNLDVQVGDRISVELIENPVSGCFWEVGNVNVKDMKIIANEYKTLIEDSGKGIRKMIFEVVKKSRGDLVLESRQKWTREIYKTFKFTYA
ncbi:MAG: protease inhibitor I42 family protein [Daejeonella sp.]